MSEIEFRVGYRYSTGKANPLFNDKDEMLITFSVPDEMYPYVTTFPSSYFFDIMRSNGFNRVVDTLEESVYTKEGSDIVAHFHGTDAGRNFTISIYTPKGVNSSSLRESILADLKGEFVRKLKLKADSRRSSGDPENVDGGKRKKRKTRKHRSRKSKKTRKH